MRYKGTISVEEVNGSAGSVTGARAKGVSYLKNKPIPTNPRTEKQQNVRGVFGTSARDFKALPFETAQAWNEAAKGKFGRQVFGVKAGISGINLFVQTNQNIAEAGGTAVTNVPTPSTVQMPEIQVLGISGYNSVTKPEGTGPDAPSGSVSGCASIVLKKVTIDTQFAVVVRTTGILVGNKVYVKNKLRVLTNKPNIGTVNGSEEQNKYGQDVTVVYFDWDGYLRNDVPNPGTRVAFEFYLINKNTGERSAPYYVDGTVYMNLPKLTTTGE